MATSGHENGRSPKKTIHKKSDWHRIVQLGEDLLIEQDPVRQSELIKSTAQAVFDCQVDVWLLDMGRETANDKKIPSIARKTLKTGQPVIKNNTAGDSCIAFSFHMNANHTALVLLIRQENFQDADLTLVHAMLDYCTRSRQGSRRHILDLLELVQSVSSKIAGVLNLEELYGVVTNHIQETFGFYYVGIFVVNPGGLELSIKARAGSHSSENAAEEELCIEFGDGIVGFAAANGELVLANDVSLNRNYRHVDSLKETVAEIALPLKYKGQVLGVLDVQSNQRNVFLDDVVLALQALADNVAIAIENARLYQDITQRAKHLASISDVSYAISSILDEDELLDQVAHLIVSRLGYEFVQLYSAHSGRKKIFFRAGVYKDQVLPKQDIIYEMESSQGIIPWVVRNAQTYIVQNTSEDTLFRPSTNIPIQTRSELSIPLIFADQVLGVLDVQSEHIEFFSDDDLYVLEALADSIATAMRNAYLYRTELWRRQVAESMQTTASLLTTNRDIKPFLSHTLKELVQILPIDVAAIWLLEDDLQKKELGPEFTANLQLSAVQISDNFQPSSTDQMTSDEVIAFYNQAGVPSVWLLSVLESDEPVTRHEDDPYEPLGAIFDFSPDYSAIAAPLTIAGRVIGVMTLCHHTAGRYGHEAQNMAIAYANYIAVAVQNNRLYKTARDQAWVSTVLLQVAEATESLGSLSDLLSTMARLVPSLVGVRACMIYLWDEGQGIFSPTACYGLVPSQETAFWEYLPTIGESASLDQAYFTKNVLFIDKENSNGTDKLVVDILDPVMESAAIFPMITHNNIIGLILIDDFPPAATEETLDRVELDDQLILLQGIAHQTAVAVENILLLQEQQEETYVSVALLQVAQAVGNLTNLDEILSSIVRLMPILIGVKRCLVFLWDSNDEFFTLSNNFGISRMEQSLLEGKFTEGKFPVLDLCRVFDQSIIYAIHHDEDSPILWRTFDETEAMMAPSDIGGGVADANFSPSTKPRLHWHHSERLLSAVPLSVKGIFLGVILTEESKTPELYRVKVREKRHEMTLGIAQQAALAIHNSLLQREVMTRDRLEREFQLSRDIQKAFMPENLPQPQGWQLAALWKPALQVSGDFYDAFELPGGRVGIVIADVADKGMPAALFMTLIRTLVRSALREAQSPAEVLIRVNELLLPDVKGGVFVTLAYFEIESATGRLTYANAGHNPPMLLRYASGKIEKLPPTGMALGIMPLPSMTEVKKIMKPGDMLLMYTDGITEAFSSDGDMFGETRLLDIMSQSKLLEPEKLTEKIIEIVEGFIGPIPYSDDLTMIAVKRCLPS